MKGFELSRLHSKVEGAINGILNLFLSTKFILRKLNSLLNFRAKGKLGGRFLLKETFSRCYKSRIVIKKISIISFTSFCSAYLVLFLYYIPRNQSIDVVIA